MHLPQRDSIFVDEAGDLGLTNASKRFFTFGFLYCKNPSQLRKRIRRYLKKVRLKNKYPRHLSELKFSLPYSELIQQGYTVNQLDNDYSIHSPKIRSHCLDLISNYSDGIFAAILDKHSIGAPTWTSEELGNFLLAETIIVNIMNVLNLSEPPLIYFDKGRLSPAKFISFSNYIVAKDSYFAYRGLKLYRGCLSSPINVASIFEPCIWAADMIAGAFYHKHQNHESAYANILDKKRIGIGERIFWKKM